MNDRWPPPSYVAWSRRRKIVTALLIFGVWLLVTVLAMVFNPHVSSGAAWW